MKVLFVNIGQLRPITLGGRKVMTGIYKEPASGPLRVCRHSLDGDVQADLKVHGGEFKAVYAYPFEHYSFWEQKLGQDGFAPGTFGENLTTSGVTEETICCGDVLRIGSTILQVTHPRTPCTKLAFKFDRPQIIKEFLFSGRSGFYLRVIQEGQLSAGDSIEIIQQDPNQVTVRELLGLTDLNEGNPELANRALRIDALPQNWRDDVTAFLNR
jgi:MOSC domain-containing protein YiiM